MAIVFDGKLRAREIDKKTRSLLHGENLKKPIKMASVLVGDSSESLIYLNLKKKKASELGMELDVINIKGSIAKQDLMDKIKSLSLDDSYQAVMIQLPLPKSFAEEDTQEVIDTIAKQKDVDGMRLDSAFTAPVVLAVLDALSSSKNLGLGSTKITAVVGAKGFVGKRITNALKERKYKLVDKTIDADVVISATGTPFLIKSSFVKAGSVIIDVGAPSPEFEEDVYAKCSFYTPVPGGIGPLTISYLMNNLARFALA